MTEKAHNDFYFLDRGDAEEVTSILIREVLKTLDIYNSDLDFDDSISQSSDPGG